MSDQKIAILNLVMLEAQIVAQLGKSGMRIKEHEAAPNESTVDAEGQ